MLIFLFAVNMGLVSGRVIRHSPEKWRANGNGAYISWKAEIFDPEVYPRVGVQVMVYKVGTVTGQIVTG